MENIKKYSWWVVILSVLIFSAVVFVSARSFSKNQSYVEVKGSSEKIVKADTAIWSISFDVKSNDVDSLYSDIQKNISSIKAFLISKGFEESEIKAVTYHDLNFVQKNGVWQTDIVFDI